MSDKESPILSDDLGYKIIELLGLKDAHVCKLEIIFEAQKLVKIKTECEVFLTVDNADQFAKCFAEYRLVKKE